MTKAEIWFPGPITGSSQTTSKCSSVGPMPSPSCAGTDTHVHTHRRQLCVCVRARADNNSKEGRVAVPISEKLNCITNCYNTKRYRLKQQKGFQTIWKCNTHKQQNTKIHETMISRNEKYIGKLIAIVEPLMFFFQWWIKQLDRRLAWKSRTQRKLHTS